MSYYAAKSLMGGSSSITQCRFGLVGEINVKYPNRDHSSDGWIGDASHSARPSDHNPDYRDGGIVRAVDIDNNGAPGEVTPLVRDLMAAVIGDPRAYYIIWNRTIRSKSYGWVPRYYGGTNPHDHHVHVSVLDGSGENNAALWLPEQPKPFKLQPLKVSISGVRKQFLIGAGVHRGGELVVNNGVGRIQHVLVHTQGAKLKVDGIAGPRTIAEFAKFELDRGGKGDARIPDRLSLRLLSNHGKRFGLVA